MNTKASELKPEIQNYFPVVAILSSDFTGQLFHKIDSSGFKVLKINTKIHC